MSIFHSNSANLLKHIQSFYFHCRFEYSILTFYHSLDSKKTFEIWTAQMHGKIHITNKQANLLLEETWIDPSHTQVSLRRAVFARILNYFYIHVIYCCNKLNTSVSNQHYSTLFWNPRWVSDLEVIEYIYYL